MNQQPFKFKAPSKGTVIFCSVLSLISGTVYYSKHHAAEARKAQCSKVSFLGDRPCGVHEMPRKVVVYLMAPPGDHMDKSRAWFHEYVKPILVAGAVDYDVMEGKSKGAIESAVIEEVVRRRRQQLAEKSQHEQQHQDEAAAASSPAVHNPYAPITPESQQQQYQQVTSMMNKTKQENDYDGMLAIGRLAWGELLRGIEKGCHSSLDAPKQQEDKDESSDKQQEQQPLAVEDNSNVQETQEPILYDEPVLDENNNNNNALSSMVDEKPVVLTPSLFSPVMYIPHENIIGWTNIPYRIYRWITDYTRITDVGQYAVAAVLNESRPLREEDVDAGNQEKRYWIGEDAEKVLEEDTPITLEAEVKNVLRTYASEDLP